MNTPNGMPFECPICGANEYTDEFTNEVVDDVIHQDTRETAYVEKSEQFIGHVCFGCSVTFQDPDKFTKKSP